MVGKFGVEASGWCSKGVRAGYQEGLWMEIRRGWEVLLVELDSNWGIGEE